MGYTPALERQKKSNSEGISIGQINQWANNAKWADLAKQGDDEKALIGVLWLYLNPNSKSLIEKAAVFDLLLMLVFNITRESEKNLAMLLAKHMMDFLDKNNVNLSSPKKLNMNS